MHFGSLLAVIILFFKFQKGIFSSSNTSDFISIKKIIIGSLPVLIFGFIFYDYISLNLRSIGIISISTIFFAITFIGVRVLCKK
jgi:undecaprenyl pyrophosphate phosphatase UppP